MIASDVADLPEPDSPTSPSVPDSGIEKVTSRTAATSPVCVAKLTFRCSTWRSEEDTFRFNLNHRIRLPYNSSVTQEADELLKKALTLPPNERATLAGSLIDSLEEVDEASAQDAWNDEIARRIEELDSGKAKTISWDEVRRRIATKLGHGQ
jgi:putative addiction module component (TIGR02574 family)